VALSKGLPSSVAEEAARIVATGLGSKVLDRARAALDNSRLWRELPFCIAREGGTVEGTMDLVFEEEDGLVIVDYKANFLGDDHERAVAALTEHYGPQAEAYGLALSAVSDRPVKEVVLLFMRGPYEETIPVESGTGSREQGLAQLIAAAATRSAPE
jgi:ATP-dependent helicase/nuclease subunit A